MIQHAQSVVVMLLWHFVVMWFFNVHALNGSALVQKVVPRGGAAPASSEAGWHHRAKP